ncbi:MAG: hypothetical protein ACR2FY_13470 [Pirellulaceae bacterium]
MPAPEQPEGGIPNPPQIDITQDEDWKDPPRVSFDQQASYEIARWVLIIFSGVYVLCFLMGFIMLGFKDAKHDSAIELIKFMIGSILPLVTLAVGYYLGDKGRPAE